MTITESRPEEAPPAEPVAGADEAEAPAVLPASSGLAGWLTTTDHKRVGQLYVVTALLALVGVLVVAAIVNVERADSGAGTVFVDAGAIVQLSSLATLGLVFLAVVPLWLGLAIHLVPLQVGAHSIAFPRAAAASYWGYLLGGALLVASYAMNGGPSGGRAEGVDLFFLSLGVLVASLLLAAVCVGATVLTLRAPGMGVRDVPYQTWASLVGVVMLLLTLPVLLASLVLLYLDHRYGQVFLGGAEGVSRYLEWLFLQPQVLVFAVPALGFIGEVVPVFGGRRQRERAAIFLAVGVFGALGFGAFLQTGFATGVREEALAIVMTVAAVLPVLALLALWGRTLGTSSDTLRITPTLVYGLTVMMFALLAVVAGAITVIDPLDLRGTTWDTGVFNAFLVGIAVTGAFGALSYWAPKMWGRLLSSGAVLFSWLAVALGVLLLVVPDLVNGLLDQPAGAWDYEADSIPFLNALTVAGAALVVLAIAVVLADLVRSAVDRSGPTAGDDPWRGFTLEWATSSPPPLGNFDGPLPPVTSETPVLDARDAEESNR